ncbi:MAG: PKD domain-containing protein, partial [Bacteroidota bacterium]
LNATFNYSGGESRADDAGWNFMGNPYAAGLDWAKVYASNRTSAGGQIVGDEGTSNGISPSIYVYMPSDRGNAGGYSNYGAFNAATGAKIGMTSGVIPSYQGFWVKTYHSSASSQAYNISLTENHKDDGAGTFYKANGNGNGPELSTLTLTDPNGSKDDVAMHFWKNANMGLDQAFDIQKFKADAYGPLLSILTTENDGLWINAIPNNKVNYVVDLKLDAVSSGSHTLSWADLDVVFGKFNCVTLTDLVTGATIDMKSEPSYLFEAEEGYSGKRFVIRATRTVEIEKATVLNATCAGSSNGLLRLDLSDFQDEHSFSLYARANSQQLVHTYAGPIKGIKQTLPAGDYILVNNNAEAGCGTREFYFTITEPAAVVAAFDIDKTYVEAGAEASFTNTSQGAVNYKWEFSDDLSSSAEVNPKHTFAVAGTFIVTLKAVNGDPGCYNSFTKTVEVVYTDQTTSVTSGTAGASAGIRAVGGGVRYSNPFTEQAYLEVYSTDGKLVKAETVSGHSGVMNIDHAGSYVVRLKAGESVVSAQVVIL